MKGDFLKKGNLRSNILFMFGANFIYALSSWIQLSLITKYASPTTLGHYTLGVAIITPLFLLCNLQLRSLILTDDNTYSFFDFFFFRQISSILFLVVVSIVVVAISFKEITILFPLVLTKIVEGNAEIINSHFQKREEMYFVVISVTIKALFNVLSIFIGLYFFSSITLGLAFAFLLNLIIYLLYDQKIAKRENVYLVKNNVSFEKIKAIFWTALPLGIVMFFISLNANVSKYFLEEFIGTEQQGVYSTISYTLILGTFVCNAVGQGIIPRLSKYYGTNNISAFNRLKNKFILFNCIVGVIAVIIAFAAGKPILTLLFSKTIAEQYFLFQLIMVLGLFIYIATALGYTLTAMRLFSIQPKINLFVLISQIIFSYFMIQQYKLNGAVYSMMLSYGLQIAISVYYIENKLYEKRHL